MEKGREKHESEKDKEKNKTSNLGKDEKEENRWQVWWDRITLIPIYIITTSALALDLIKDGTIENHFILVVAIAMNAGLANMIIKIWKKDD